MTTDLQHNDGFEIDRRIDAPLARVWRAWADPDQKRAWFGGSLTEIDFRVGGIERGAFEDGMGRHTKECTFFEIEDEARIVYAYSMAVNGRVHTVSLVTLLFAAEGDATRLRHVEQMCVIPPSDGVPGREHGWTVLLQQLATYVEAAAPASAG